MNTPSAPTLKAQAPNRKGNQALHPLPQPAQTGNGKVSVCKPKSNYGNNDGYRSSSYLK
jgi:hypothetical protein